MKERSEMKTLELSKCSTFRKGVPRWNDVVLDDHLTGVIYFLSKIIFILLEKAFVTLMKKPHHLLGVVLTKKP